jgi:hypothetical protein
MKISSRFPSSIEIEAPKQSVVETRVEAHKVPGRGNTTASDSFDEVLANRGGTIGRVPGRGTDQVEETNSQSLIGSLVEKYKGPDSVKQDEIESQVEKYQGPKLVRGRVIVETGIEVHKVPGRGNTTASDSFEEVLANRGGTIGRVPNRSSDPKEETAASQSSQIDSQAEKYKGPDSIQRVEIESKVNKYRGPESL